MHLLQKHLVHVQCSSQLLGKEIQSTLSDVLEKDFYPKLELILDQYSIENYEWQIENLSIEVPKISQKNWKKELVNQTLIKIEEYLKDHFPALELDKNKEKLENFGFESQAKFAENLFFKYLKTGFVAENSYSKNVDEIVEEIEISEDFIARIIAVFDESKTALIRFYFNSKESFKEKVSSEILKYSNSRLPISEMLKVFLNSEIIFYSVEELEKWLVNEHFYSEYSDLLGEKDENQQNRNLYISDKNTSDESCNSNERSYPNEKSDSNEIGSDKLNLRKQESSGNDHESNGNDHESSIDFTETNNLSIQENFRTNTSKLHISSHYVDNAGLIILHPFFLNLFQKLNLCVDEVWVDKKSQHKAVLLTQYLINGEEIFFENELVLNKLICGFPIESVINTKQKISKEEKEMCNNLLMAVLEYWSVMKNSSVEALRETFLLRAGKLSLSEANSWEMWVEEKGVDVLLAGLPWGIGMIQTPFMDNFLHCYWN